MSGKAKKSKKRLRELEDAHQLSQAEEWQRAQAWATWEAIQSGDARDVPMEEFRSLAEQTLARLDTKARAVGRDGAASGPKPRRAERAR